MYISKLAIKNFRGIKDLSIEFKKGLNVLIGENNSGKSSIIDAICICLNYGKPQTGFYIQKKDFHLYEKEQKQFQPIEFHFDFTKDEDDEVGIFHSLLGVDSEEKETFSAHFVYSLIEKKGQWKVRTKIWGGDVEGNSISVDEFNDQVFSIYLDALRDAEGELRPGRTNKIGNLFNKLEPVLENQKVLADEIKLTLSKSKGWNDLLKRGRESISDHLDGINLKSFPMNIDLKFLPAEYKKIVDSLVISLNNGEEPALSFNLEIAQNGLGLNNLLYSSVVLSDMQTFKERESLSLAALLIEEPEAHLHPQQQNLFFEYLSNFSEKSKFQIFITSHSPNITAKAPLSSLSCIKKLDTDVACFSPAKVLGLESQIFLHKFLDTTKSQLFFSNGTILVEGISEALLIPIFARKLGYDLGKLGIEVVNVGGVAFSHFAKLYNNKEQLLRMNTRCSLITDDDSALDSEEISSRANLAKTLEGGNLKVFLGRKTFEVELFQTGSNAEILISLWAVLHPRSKIEPSNNVAIYAENFLKKVEANKAKSELAYELFRKLEKDVAELNSFQVPSYISEAITWVVNGEL